MATGIDSNTKTALVVVVVLGLFGAVVYLATKTKGTGGGGVQKSSLGTKVGNAVGGLVDKWTGELGNWVSSI